MCSLSPCYLVRAGYRAVGLFCRRLVSNSTYWHAGQLQANGSARQLLHDALPVTSMKAQTKSRGNTSSSLIPYPSSWPWQADGLPGSMYTSLNCMEACDGTTDALTEQHALEDMFAESWEAAQQKPLPISQQPWACSPQGGAGPPFMDDLLAASQLPALKPEPAEMYSSLIIEQPRMMKQAVNVIKHEHQALSVRRPHSSLCDAPKPTTPTTSDKVSLLRSRRSLCWLALHRKHQALANTSLMRQNGARCHTAQHTWDGV